MARTFPRSFALLRGCSLALLAVGCSGAEHDDSTRLLGDPVDLPEVLGGQSGTEGGQSYQCPLPSPAWQGREVAPDELLPLLELTSVQLAASLAAVRLPGRWLAAGRAELSVELDTAQPLRDLGETTSSGQVCNSAIGASLIVRTSDGLLEATVPARIVRPDFDTLTLDATLPALPAAVLGAAYPADAARVRQLAPPPADAGPALHISVQRGDVLQSAVLYQGGQPRGVWLRDPMALPWGPPLAFTPDARFSEACAGAAELQGEERHFTPFASRSAALAGITKVWVRCLDAAPASHAGIEILPDGSWRHFDIEAGELVARSGFGHEGQVRLTDTSLMNGPGFFQLDLTPYGRSYDAVPPVISDGSTAAYEQGLVFRFYNPQEDWPAAVYQPTSLSVRSVAPEYADGERAGSAACDRPERSLVFDAAQAAPSLSGEFVLCSGSLRGDVARLRFAPAQVELLAADGDVIATQAFDPASGAVQLEGRSWSLLVSRQPLKVLVQEQLDYGVSRAVFSAVP